MRVAFNAIIFCFVFRRLGLVVQFVSKSCICACVRVRVCVYVCVYVCVLVSVLYIVSVVSDMEVNFMFGVIFVLLYFSFTSDGRFHTMPSSLDLSSVLMLFIH